MTWYFDKFQLNIYAFIEGEQINLSFNLWVVIIKKGENVESSGFDDLT